MIAGLLAIIGLTISAIYIKSLIESAKSRKTAEESSNCPSETGHVKNVLIQSSPHMQAYNVQTAQHYADRCTNANPFEGESARVNGILRLVEHL